MLELSPAMYLFHQWLHIIHIEPGHKLAVIHICKFSHKRKTRVVKHVIDVSLEGSISVRLRVVVPSCVCIYVLFKKSVSV